MQELAAVIGETSVEAVLNVEVNDVEAVKAAIKQSFTALMRCDTKVILDQVSSLVTGLQTAQPDCK